MIISAYPPDLTMKLFAKLFAVGFTTIFVTTATNAAPRNETFAGDALPFNCRKKTVKQVTRETYRLCHNSGKPIEIEYEYFDRIATTTTFSYRNGRLTKSCENQLDSCIGFLNDQGIATWKAGERETVLIYPDDRARAAADLKRSQAALKLFKLSDNQSTPPKATKFQNVREYFLAVPDKFIPNIKQKDRAKLIAIDSSNITEGYLEFNIPNNTVPPKYKKGLLTKKGEVRLFKHQQGHVILGMLVTFCQKPGICQSESQFLEYKSGVWGRVTDTILPKISEEEAAKLARQSVNTPKLPPNQKITTHYGLGIADGLQILHGTCLDKSCVSLYILQSYTWNGSEFVVYQYPEGH
jgi:hypothetical protein